MLEACVPNVEEHCQILIYVKQFGFRSTTFFNCLLERLQREQCVQVSDNPKRIFVANFVSTINSNLYKFGELQAHRRVIGFVGVVQAPPSEQQPSTSQNPSADFGSSEVCESNEISSKPLLTLQGIKEQYDIVKKEFESTVVDSRCIVFGYPEEEVNELWSSREVFSFRCLDETDSLECGIREFLRAIFYVLESRRLDLSFEKLDNPPCPSIPDEQKYRMGVENKNSKMYRRKCIGRLRKQVADYSLVTGLPTLALDAYQSAIDHLKQANDYLWLAAAYEGWACSALIAMHELTNNFTAINSIQRISSMTIEQMRLAAQHNYGTAFGHQRHWSDEDPIAKQLPTINIDEQQRRSFSLNWNVSLTERSGGKTSVTNAEIVEKFRMALENFERFSFAAWIEYECMIKATSVFRHQRHYVEMEGFMREHIGKYLDDSFSLFDHLTKATICLNSAAIYKKIGFKRKSAFFARLAVLFRLYVSGDRERSVMDYRVAYPILYGTLMGYGMPDNPKEVTGDLSILGPVQIQRRALHEVFMSALRADYHQAAIRHLCYLLQVYYDYMDHESLARMFEELDNLVTSVGVQHQLGHHISLPQHGLIISPIQMTRFPKLDKFMVCPLPSHLAVTIVYPKRKSDVFIYCPFQNSDSAKAVTWVCDCACEVAVSVANCLPYELSVRNLALLAEGCAFEPIPIRLNLAPYTNSPIDIRLIGVPREAGRLTITGYSCDVLGVHNVCKLRDLPDHLKSKIYHSTVFEIQVLPALPVLELQTSLSRAPISEGDIESTAEITVYSGQIFEHTVSLVNTSDSIAVRDVTLEIKQPKVCGGPCMIELASDDWFTDSKDNSCRRIFALEQKNIRFRIFGIDPSAMAEDETLKEGQNLECEVGNDCLAEESHDRIPFTGRLLTCEFIFSYRADIGSVDEEQYERRCRLPLAVNIVPAVTVAAWHVLPGDGPTTRYVVVDVTNSTDWDAELTYSKDKVISVQPHDFCRVPLLCECCSEVASNAFHQAATRASHMMQMQEMERLRRILERHVSSHLDIRWTISSSGLSGTVPVGPLLSSVALLKQLVIPVITIEQTINGTSYLSEDEVPIGIGEVVEIGLRLISPTNDGRSFKGTLKLQCYRDLQNGSYIESNDNMIVLNMESLPFHIIRDEFDDETHCLVQLDTISIENDYIPAGLDTETSLVEQTRIRETFQAFFDLMFRCEGVYKIRPLIVLDEQSSAISQDELFCCAISFNVTTKAC